MFLHETEWRIQSVLDLSPHHFSHNGPFSCDNDSITVHHFPAYEFQAVVPMLIGRKILPNLIDRCAKDAALVENVYHTITELSDTLSVSVI